MLSPTPYPLWVSITLSPKSGGDSSGIVESNPEDGSETINMRSPLLYARLRPPRLALGQTEPKCRERIQMSGPTGARVPSARLFLVRTFIRDLLRSGFQRAHQASSERSDARSSLT